MELPECDYCSHQEWEYDENNYPYCVSCGEEQEPDWDLIAKYQGEEGPGEQDEA